MSSALPANTSFTEREKRLQQLNQEIDRRLRTGILSPRTQRMTAATAEKLRVQSPTKPSTQESNDPFIDSITEQFRNTNFGDRTDSDMDTLRNKAPAEPAADRMRRQAPTKSTTRVKSTGRCSNPSGPSEQVSVARRNNLSSDSTIRFLKTKVCILQQELVRERSTNEAHNLLAAKQLDERKRLLGQVDRLQVNNQQLLMKCEQMERSSEQMRNLITDKDEQLAEAQRMLDERTLRCAQLETSVANLERRLTKSDDDLGHTRSNVIAAKAAEMQRVKMHKADREHAERELKLLAEQRSGLITIYKKQMYLLDNLRRQNACLENAKELEFVERDFVRMLEHGNGMQ